MQLLLFQKETAIVLPQNGTYPCAVNALLRPKISVWYGDKTSNVHANCHSFKKTAIVLPQKGTCPYAVKDLLRLQISVWYGNKTSNVHASRLYIAEKIQSCPKCQLSLHPDNYPSCTAVRLHLHQIEMSDCANVFFDCFVQGNLLTSCKSELQVVFLCRKLLILFG